MPLYRAILINSLFNNEGLFALFLITTKRAIMPPVEFDKSLFSQNRPFINYLGSEKY